MVFKKLPRHILNEYIPDSLIIDNIVLHSSTDTIYFKDVDSKFLLHNGAHLSYFKVDDPNDLVGKSDFDFYPLEEAKAKRADEVKIMKTGIALRDQLEEGINDKKEKIFFSVSKYPLYDYNGKIIGTWGTSREVTKLILAERELALVNKRLKELTRTDNVTGLYNQRHFYEVLEKTMSLYKRKRSKDKTADFCLVFIDIDHFKKVNDQYGHIVGDMALSHIAAILRNNTRSTDEIFRYGGDEYAVILFDSSLESGSIYAENIRKKVEDTPFIFKQNTINLTMSIGLVSYNDEQESSQLVVKSDIQLYKAKENGRNRVEIDSD